MTDNFFIEKFKSKSDTELERIAMDSKSFVLDARYAAVTLLKTRNYDSPIISKLEEEYKNLLTVEQKEFEHIKERDRRLIKRIRQISIKENRKYGLRNGNELQVKRLNENLFQVRIKAFRSELAPVIICRIKDETTYFCFPFLYLKSVLIFGIGGATLTTILAFLEYVKNEPLIFFLPLIVIIGFQVLLIPFLYFFILSFFRNRLGKK